MKAKIIVLGILLLLSLGLAACGNASGGSGTANGTTDGNKYLKVWVPSEEVDMTQQMCDMFLKQSGYDSLTIECKALSMEDSIQAVNVDPGTAADVFMYSTGDGRNLVDSGLLLPIALNYDTLKESFEANAFASVSLDGYLFGIPIDPSTWILCYNKDIFTADDVTSIETMLQKDTGAKYNFSCCISSNWYIEAFYYAKGCTLFGADGKQPGQCSWNDADGYQVSKYLLDLAQHPAYYEDLDGYAMEYFLSGELGAICTSIGSAAGLKEALGDSVGVVKLPTANIGGEDVQLRNFVDYLAFGVNSYTKYPKEAQELAIWLGSAECQMMRYEQFGVLPTLTELFETEVLNADETALAAYSQFEHCVVVPPIQEMNDYWASAAAFGEGIVQGTITDENLKHYLDVLVEHITVEFVED